MIATTIGEFLKRERISYRTITHPIAYTAQEEAVVAHVSARHWAKTVVCLADDQPVQVVVPADMIVDVERLRELTGAGTVRLCTEDEMATLYPECDRGAMPPFGPLYGQKVYVDTALAEEPEIVFNGGTHVDAIEMDYADFANLVHPVVVGSRVICHAERDSPTTMRSRPSAILPRKPTSCARGGGLH